MGNFRETRKVDPAQEAALEPFRVNPPKTNYVDNNSELLRDILTELTTIRSIMQRQAWFPLTPETLDLLEKIRRQK